MHAILTHLLSAPPTVATTDTVESWSATHALLAQTWTSPCDLALAAGFAADRPAWAFASGYGAAIRALVPILDALARVALAVTEDGGNTPRAIATTVRDDGTALVLTGVKSFITLGTHAEEMLVLSRLVDPEADRNASNEPARNPIAHERPRLVVVRVPVDTVGVILATLPAPPFVPEIPHARATFSEVRLPREALLRGDGWSDYVKPFRTVEDAHVHAALLGYLVGVGRRASWPRDVLEHLASLVTGVRTLCCADRDAPATHVALSGVLAATRALAVDASLWDRVDDAARTFWLRDRALLAVAEKARTARLSRAWERLLTPNP